jgi:hypothetical protein
MGLNLCITALLFSEPINLRCWELWVETGQNLISVKSRLIEETYFSFC